MSLKQWLLGKLNGRSIGDFVSECQWALGYVVRFKGTVFVHVLLGVLGILLTFVSSVSMKVLIDSVTGLDSGLIVSSVSFMIGARLCSMLMRSCSSYIGSNMDLNVQNKITRDVFSRIFKTDWESLESYRSGDLLNRIGSDVHVISGGVTGFIPSLVSCFVQLMGSFLILFYFDSVMALIALCTVPLTVVCSGLFGRRLRLFNQKMKEVNSDLLSFEQDALSNMTMIKSFGLNEDMDLRLVQIQDTYSKEFKSYHLFSVCASFILGVLSLVTSMSCFLWAVYRLKTGFITFGDLALFLQLSGYLGSSFSTMISLVPSLISICTSSWRVMSLMSLPEECVSDVSGLLEESEFEICLEGVSFGYQGGLSVLKDCDFKASSGSLVAIAGPSGEGKTTLLRILLGLVSVDNGSSLIIGGSGTVYPLCASTRCLFGYVPQKNQMMHGTIRENLMMLCDDVSDEELKHVLYLCCAEFVFELESGLDYVIGGRDHRLSEGQIQRLAIARALLRKAPVLLLDEATSALDEETEELMLQRLMNSDIVSTCIFVTHRPFAKSLCECVYELNDGHLEVVHE